MGNGHRVSSSARNVFVAGFSNVAAGCNVFVAGSDNTAWGSRSCVAGGVKNEATGRCSLVAGGVDGSATAFYASVFGGSAESLAGSRIESRRSSRISTARPLSSVDVLLPEHWILEPRQELSHLPRALV